jgi:hypothetical protein
LSNASAYAVESAEINAKLMISTFLFIREFMSSAFC